MQAATLEQTLSPLTSDPSAAAVLLDVDGTLAPIVADAENAVVPAATRIALAAVAERYAVVACVTGRRPLKAREMVGLGQIAYYGNHGAEYLGPADERPVVSREASEWQPRVREFADGAFRRHRLDELGVRTEDKGPIAGLHWRGCRDEEAARRRIREIAAEAEAAGLGTHWAKKILEIRPPILFSKGTAVARIIREHQLSAAAFIGDDLTDLNAFAALDEARASGAIGAAIKVGVESEEAPAALAPASDVMLAGTDEVRELLELLAAT